MSTGKLWDGSCQFEDPNEAEPFSSTSGKQMWTLGLVRGGVVCQSESGKGRS